MQVLAPWAMVRGDTKPKYAGFDFCPGSVWRSSFSHDEADSDTGIRFFRSSYTDKGLDSLGLDSLRNGTLDPDNESKCDFGPPSNSSNLRFWSRFEVSMWTKIAFSKQLHHVRLNSFWNTFLDRNLDPALYLYAWVYSHASLPRTVIGKWQNSKICQP